jgi:hypothetical protein
MNKIWNWSKKWSSWSRNYKKQKEDWRKRLRWEKSCQLGCRNRSSKECISLRNWTSSMLSYWKRGWNASLASMTAKTIKFRGCRPRWHSRQDRWKAWGNNLVKIARLQRWAQRSHRQIRINNQQIQARVGWGEAIIGIDDARAGGGKTIDQNAEWAQSRQKRIARYLHNCQIKETVR